MKIQKYPFTLEMSKDKFIKFRYNMMQQRKKNYFNPFEYTTNVTCSQPPKGLGITDFFIYRTSICIRGAKVTPRIRRLE